MACDLSNNFQVSSATFYIGAFSYYSTCFIPPALNGAYCVYLVLNWVISGFKVNFGKIAFSEYPHFFCTFVFNLLLFCTNQKRPYECIYLRILICYESKAD